MWFRYPRCRHRLPWTLNNDHDHDNKNHCNRPQNFGREALLPALIEVSRKKLIQAPCILGFNPLLLCKGLSAEPQ